MVEWRGEAAVQRHDGTLVPVEIWHRPISLLSGGATIDTLRDITERKAQEQFEQDFLADVAHDLKTPLTVNKAQVQMLQRRQRQGRIDFATMGESLAAFNANTDRMVRRLDELTDLAQLRSGRDLDLRLESLDLVSLVQESVTYFSRSTERHTIEIDNRLEMSNGTWDMVRLQRVIENLLSNAIKYSPKGGTITVTLAHDRRDNRDWAIISVRDQGIGIPATDLPNVFERYRRGSNVATRISGTGIGLAGAHHIVEQHGGSISVASTEGVGSVFTVELPLEPV
jgi:signal transduction histidine kinase